MLVRHCGADCSGVMDLVFLLHSAGSVHARRWQFMTQFVGDIVSQLDVAADRTRVGVVYWSDDAHIGFTLDRYTIRQDVIAVRQLRHCFTKTQSDA